MHVMGTHQQQSLLVSPFVHLTRLLLCCSHCFKAFLQVVEGHRLSQEGMPEAALSQQGFLVGSHTTPAAHTTTHAKQLVSNALTSQLPGN